MNRVITQKELDEAARFAPMCAARLLGDGKTPVKSGESTRMVEASTMRFISEHTNIPVPKIYNAYRDETTGLVRIVMEYIH